MKAFRFVGPPNIKRGTGSKLEYLEKAVNFGFDTKLFQWFHEEVIMVVLGFNFYPLCDKNSKIGK